MRSKFQHFVFFLSLVGMFISCTEQENPRPEDGLIHHPFGGEIIYRSRTCRISWNTPSWSSLDIELNNGSGVSWQICEALPNSGAYSWDIPKEIPDGTTYSLRVSNSENPESVLVHTGPFEIRAQGEFSTLTDIRLMDAIIIKSVIDGNHTLWTLDKKINNNIDSRYIFQHNVK